MRTIPEVFLANEIKQFAIPGGRIEILSCSAAGTVSVSLQDANGVEVTNGFAKDIEAGSYMQPPGGFQRFSIASNVAQTVKFLISSGDAGTRSVAGTVAVSGTVSVAGTVAVAGTVSVAGNVNVIDGGKLRTLGGTSYIGGRSSPAVAGSYSHLQLLNPAGSGKNLVITQIQYGTLSAAGIYITRYSIALPNDYSASITNKLNSGAATVAKLLSGSQAALLGVPFMYNYVVIKQMGALLFSDPLVLAPGNGIALAGDAQNSEITGVFEYFEE